MKADFFCLSPPPLSLLGKRSFLTRDLIPYIYMRRHAETLEEKEKKRARQRVVKKKGQHRCLPLSLFRLPMYMLPPRVGTRRLHTDLHTLDTQTDK